VFQDLMHPHPETALIKAKLAQQIRDLIIATNLTQAVVARRLDVDQPKVSNLLRGRLNDFSLERLFRFLNLLGQNIDIRLSPSPDDTGRVRMYRKAG